MTKNCVEPRNLLLERMRLLRGIPSGELRRIAGLGAHIARQDVGEPVVAVHLFDDDEQHRVAAVGGATLGRTPAGDSICIQVVDGKRPIYTPDATAETRFDGNPFTSGTDPVRLYYSTPMTTMDGTTLGTLCVFASEPGLLGSRQRDRIDDLAGIACAHLELSSLNQDLVHLATHDPLTKVANRLLLSHELEQALSVHRAAPALLLADLNDFKAVNDHFGHQVGDEVLASTARRLSAAVRSGDLVARLGGDEFAILLKDVPAARDLDDVVHRIADLTRVPHHTSGGPVVCPVSVGRAVRRPHDLAYELFGRADEDMYRAKRLRTPTAPAPC